MQNNLSPNQKKIEENLKTLIYNKIKKTNNDLNNLRSDLEYHNYCLTYKGNNSKLRFDELIGMWDKYSNSLIEFFGRDDFYLISTFFQNLPELNGYSSHHLITECNTSELWEKKVLIEHTVYLGEHILNKVYSTSAIRKENTISEKTFKKIINPKNLESLERQFQKIDKKGKSIELSKKIKHHYSDIPKSKVSIFIKFLSKHGFNLERKFEGYPIVDILRNIILQFEDPEQRFNTIKEYIEKSTSLWIPLILFHEEMNPERVNKEKIFKNEQLNSIKEVLLNQIHLWNEKGQLLNCYRLYDVLALWSLYENKDVVEEFIKGCFKEEERLISFINGFSFDMVNFDFRGEYTEEYTTKEYNFYTMERLIDLEWFKEELDKQKYLDKHEDLIEFKKKIEKYISEKKHTICV